MRTRQTPALSTEEMVRLAEDQAVREEAERRRKEVGRLIRRARSDASMFRPELAAILEVHLNTLANWENGIGDAERYFAALEDATGKPEGWFEHQLDPLAWIAEMSEEIKLIRRELGTLARFVKKRLGSPER